MALSGVMKRFRCWGGSMMLLSINIQGDEPLIEPEIIDGIVKVLQVRKSQSSIPIFTSSGDSGTAEIAHVLACNLFIDLDLMGNNYVCTELWCKVSKIYSELPPTPLQLEEDLEQLKVLENGYKMKVIKVEHECHGVDVPADVQKIEHYMRQRNLS